MTRVRRLSLYSLLMLMQVIAPWVHAHTVSETGGFLHLPGLEWLAANDKGSTVAAAYTGRTDMIVAVQAGMAGEVCHARINGLPDGQDGLPVLVPVQVLFRPVVREVSLARVEARTMPPRLSPHIAVPRAPPVPFPCS